MSYTKFIKTALKDYKVGAVTRTSKFVVKKILTYIKPEYKYFLEYGPGDGVVTREILKKVPEGGKFVVIELNEEFFRELSKIKDPRFKAVKGDIAEYSNKLHTLGLPRVDFALSSVPFTIIGPNTREEILKNTAESMSEGGTFVMFQYSLLMRSVIKKAFKNVSYYLEPRNFPPYFIMTAVKK